jgi:hypothetical protein
MDWYSVNIEFRAADEQQVTDEAIEEFMSIVEPHDGVVSGGAGYPIYDATVGVTAADAPTAAEQGRALVVEAAAKADLPDWPIVRVEVVREDVLDDEQSRPNLPKLVSGPEAGGILGVNRQRVHQLSHEHPEFPPPLYRLAVGSLWDRRAIEAFGAEWDRRPGRRSKLAG